MTSAPALALAALPVRRVRQDPATALVAAAIEQPGTVRQLAHRAGVSTVLAPCTVTRLLQAGLLARLGAERPAVLAPGPWLVVAMALQGAGEWAQLGDPCEREAA